MGYKCEDCGEIAVEVHYFKRLSTSKDEKNLIMLTVKFHV